MINNENVFVQWFYLICGKSVALREERMVKLMILSRQWIKNKRMDETLIYLQIQKQKLSYLSNFESSNKDFPKKLKIAPQRSTLKKRITMYIIIIV